MSGPCSRSLLRRRIARTAPSAVLLTYASHLPPLWLLGLSAALHDVPLVVIGFGLEYSGDNQQKALGTMRAASVLRRVWPRTVLLVVDSWDTIVVNPTRRAAAALRPVETEPGAVLLSTECNSWPRCYRADFSRDAELRRCLASPRRTCFVNGGM